MSITCINVINELNNSIEKVNYQLIDHMTENDNKYEWVCVKPDVTYEYYYAQLKEEWERIINDFVDQPATCGVFSDLLSAYQYSTPANIAQFKNMLEAISQVEAGTRTDFSGINIDDIVLDVVATSIITPERSIHFVMEKSMVDTIFNLANTLSKHCNCQLVDIFRTVIKKYKKKYSVKFEGKSKDDVIKILRNDYNKFKDLIRELSIPANDKLKDYNKKIKEKTVTDLSQIFTLSVDSELEKLIPNELGSLKEFFIKVISKYYDNLHPIIWAQIFRGLTENVFKELPFTEEEIFSFVSKYLLLNSGPFILKILQTIRPVLSPELQKKYNLTKLTYPLMKPAEVNLVLSKVVIDWPLYDVLKNFSASVGHVCLVKRVDLPQNILIIKIIKPLAIAQSCWEYKTLYDIFPTGTCEQQFIKNMLESNGREMNVRNEIDNINKGYQYYTANYKDVFSVDIDAKLTTVQNITGVIADDTWFALAMTLAPGIPLSKLVENNLVKTDTKYRAKLHRCLDLLVYKFFYNIIENGFYHGDLHAGNIFFSYEQSQATLIDFGAVGELNIYGDDTNIKTLLEIVVMATFYDYDQIFDKMTILLNSKCNDNPIDMNSAEYINFKEQLRQYKYENIINYKREKEISNQYEKDIFGSKRIADENGEQTADAGLGNTIANSSIYSFLEYTPQKEEEIIENRNVLPAFTEILGDTTSQTFASVLEKIIKFYALAGVNIAIKFSDFYEFQKAYALLLGVLTRVGYNSYRSGIAIRKAIINLKNLPKLANVGTSSFVIKSYWEQRGKFKELSKQLTSDQSTSVVGGGHDEQYYLSKYLKYKTKYLKLHTSK